MNTTCGIPKHMQRLQGRIQEFLIWGGPNFGSERTVELSFFFEGGGGGRGGGGGIYSSLTRHPNQSQLYVIIPWSLTV